MVAARMLVMSSAESATIVQSGLGFDWKMTASSEKVTIGEETFPKITIPLGTDVTFEGQTGDYHFFSVQRGNEVPLFEVGMGGQPFSVNFSPKSAGLYTYFCPPHKSFMKGFIEVVASPSSRCKKRKRSRARKAARG